MKNMTVLKDSIKSINSRFNQGEEKSNQGDQPLKLSSQRYKKKKRLKRVKKDYRTHGIP